MLEDNFVYISAMVSIFAVAYVVAKVVLILHMKDNFETSRKFRLVTLITAAVYEVITLTIMGVLFNNVILNIYCYLFLADALFVFVAFIVFDAHYRMFRRRAANGDIPVEDAQDTQTNKAEDSTNKVEEKAE